MNVKKNDTVYVLTGKDAGKTGKVLAVLPKTNRVKVDGVNVQKKSKKARSARDTSGIIEQVGPIDASNVMLVFKGKPTRVGFKMDGDKKVRVAKSTGDVID